MEYGSFEAALTAFASAISAGDEAAARAASAPSAWHLGGDTPQALFRQSQGRRGFVLTVREGLSVEDDKGWGVCAVHERALQDLGRPPRSYGTLTVMLQRGAGGTPKVVGVTKEATIVKAWVAGLIGPTARMASLPISEIGTRWAEGVRVAVMTRGDISEAAGDPTESGVMATMMLQQALNQPDAVVAVLPVREVADAGRIAVGFLITTPSDSLGDEIWVTLQADADGRLRLLSTSTYMSLAILLQDASRVTLDVVAPVSSAPEPAEPAEPVTHWDPFAAALKTAKGPDAGSGVDADTSAGASLGSNSDDDLDIIGPAPLLEQPEVTAEMRDALAQTMALLKEQGAPTNVAEFRDQTSQLLNAAFAGVVKAISEQTGAVKPSEDHKGS